MKNRFTAIFLSVCLLLGSAACGGAPGAAEEQKAALALTDAAGRTLEKPEDGSSEVIAAVYGTVVPFLVALQLTDRVTAVNCKSNFWKKADENLGRAGTVGKGVVDIEALAASGATVLVHRANDPQTVEAVERLGLDVVCIRAENMEEIYSTLRLLGDYFGENERADEVIGWMDAKFAEIDGITAGIPEDRRHTALVMGGELGRIAGGDMVQTWMIEKAGGIPVAAQTENDSRWLDIGVETVLKWDPEFIFCTSSASLDYTVEEVLEDAGWSAAKSVTEGHVSRIPSKLDTWDMPGIANVICTFWMLHEMYPEYLSLERLEAEIDEYYEFMFGKTFEAAYLGYELK